MSEAKKGDNKTVVLVAAVVVVAVVAGALVYMNEQKKETVSINIGGKEISATFEN